MPGFWDAYQRSKEATTGILARHYVGGALSRGDIAGAAQQAYRLGMYGEGQTLAAQAQQQAEMTRRQNIGAQVASGDTRGATNEALQGGDFQTANAVQAWAANASEQERAAAGRRSVALARAAASLKTVPYEGRRGALATMIPQLQAEGITPEQIEAFDPTDEAIGGVINNARTLDQILESQRPIKASAGDTFLDPNTYATIAAVPPKPQWQEFTNEDQSTRVVDMNAYESGPNGEPVLRSGVAATGQPARPGVAAPPPATGARIQLRPPVPGDPSSPFGPRTAPRTNMGRGSANHGGVDYPVPVGTPVMAAADGVVVDARPVGGYGNQIRVRHPDGTETTYSHLSRIGVKPGDPVQAGAPIGASGATGNVSGPNLHFEVIESGNRVNPASRFGQPARAGRPQGQPQARPQGARPALGDAPRPRGRRMTPEEVSQTPGLDPNRSWWMREDGKPEAIGDAPRNLRPIPTGPMQRYIDLGQSAKKLNDALVAVRGYPQGLGFVIGRLDPDIQQRVDQGGVDVRAAIGDIGSLIIRERSGAAVTISESPRFRPFVPLITDTPETAEKKLIRLLGMIADEQAAMESEYSQDQGYRGFAPPRQAVARPRVGEVRNGYRYKGGDPNSRASWERAS